MLNRPLPHWTLLLLLTAVTLLLTAVYLQNLLAFTGGQLGVPLDDAWIHFQFARNIAQGNGFSFNPGDLQPGSTAPLWTLLLAGVGLFTEQFLIPAIGFSFLFLMVMVWLSYGFTFQLSTNRFAAFLAGLGVAMTGRLLWAGLSGMEATAFAAVSLAAVWLYTRTGLRPWAALLFGLAAQIRPEGHLLFGLAVLDTIFQLLKQRLEIGNLRLRDWRLSRSPNLQSPISNLIISLLIYFLISLPYTLFSLSITARPLPNTFYAKVGSEHFFSLRTLREMMALHWGDNPISLLLLLAGLWPTWKRSRLTVLWLLGLWLVTPVIIDQVWHHGRYTMPLIPFQMIVAAVGVNWLLQRLEIGSLWLRDWRFFSSLNLQSLISITILLLFILGAGWRFNHWRDMLATNANEVLEIDVVLGQWLAENTPPEALLAIDDIGAITYLSQRKIVDMNGLVSPEVWPAVRQPVGLPRDTRLTRILSHSRPDYVVAFPLWHFEMTNNAAVLTPIYKVETDTHTIIFQPEAEVYEAEWPYLEEVIPENEVDAVLGDALALLGFDEQVSDTAVDLTLYWQSQQTLPADYDLFVHILNENGEIVAQADQQPLNGLTPTSQWQPGDFIRQPLTIPLPADLTPGSYQVNAGMFLRETGQRLAARGLDTAVDYIQLTTFTK